MAIAGLLASLPGLERSAGSSQPGAAAAPAAKSREQKAQATSPRPGSASHSRRTSTSKVSSLASTTRPLTKTPVTHKDVARFARAKSG